MNDQELKEFKNLVEYCRKAGIESLKNGSLEVKFIQEALLPKTPYQLKKEQEDTKKALEEAHASSLIESERALMWSSSIPDQGVQ